ncbi:MAG: hypothetical protein U1F26_16815 [Lysobacterales bacterium]
MKYARLVATHDDEPSETLVVVGQFNYDDWLVPKQEAFGYVKDLEMDGNLYRYPFILEPDTGKTATLNWGGFDDTLTLVDLLNRRLAKGEKIVRTEGGERYSYTIISMHLY